MRRRWRAGGGALALLFALACGAGERPLPGTGGVAGESALVAQSLPSYLEARQRTAWPPCSPDLARARAALAQGEDGRAESILLQTLRTNPGDTEALFLASALYYQQARFGLALQGFEEVLRRGPRFAGCEAVFHYYGACQLRLGDEREARAAFLAHLELVPESDESLQALGELELQSGNAAQALAHFEHAASGLESARARGEPVEAALARARAGMASAYVQQGALAKARACLEQALAAQPDDVAAHYALSRVLLRLGDEEGAARELSEHERLRIAQTQNVPDVEDRR